MKILYFYLILINLAAVIVTVHDKHAAEKGRWRAKESSLLLIAAFGGSPMMLLTMLVIRHKTKKPKFMVGIPLIMAVQLIVIYLVLHDGYRLL